MPACAEPDGAFGRRLLFASYHGYVDPSSGAAVSARELLAMLARHGWEVRTICGPRLDFERSEDVRQILADQRLPYRETVHEGRGGRFSLLWFRDGAILSCVFVPLNDSERRPSRESGSRYLEGFSRMVAQWQPRVLLTYGGDWVAAPMLEDARRAGVRVVFWLRNFAYRDASLFRLVDRVVVPSAAAAAHYRDGLGLKPVAIPSPLDWDRVVCEASPGQRFVTFVNPQPHKGALVFARIAEQLFRRRPDVPLLIVEGRGGAGWLERTGLDLSGLTNLHVMENTPDPRDFYRASRLVLMPSLCRESFGRVAAEAMINGIPVLGSTRGALAELLGECGFLFHLPDRYTPETRAVPSAEEIRPWIETILRLWDDQAFYAEASRRCRERAQAWRPERLWREYGRLFEELLV